MSTDDTYQGWTNRETWALMLHINNDQGLYNLTRDWLRQAEIGAEAEYVEASVTDLLDPVAYADEYGTEWPAALAMMAREVGSLWRVNWTEVVAALTED